MKTATATTNWQKWWSVAIELARRQDLPLGDRCGCRQSDQAALTLPVRGIIFLFEPLVQRRVCLAVLRRILVSVVQRHRQDVQRIFQIPTVQSDWTHALPQQAVVQCEGLWQVFSVAFQLPPFHSGDQK